MTTIFSAACDRETGWPLERVPFALVLLAAFVGVSHSPEEAGRR